MPKPAALRPVSGQHVGTTAFFRNRAFMTCLIELLADLNRTESHLRILFHSCSVGAEPYSFAMEACMSGLYQRYGAIAIEATDIEPSFLAAAQRAVYPIKVLQSVPMEARRFFISDPDEGEVHLAPELMEAVRFLPAASFGTFEPAQPYDVVLALNSLTYVSTAEQKEAIRRMARYTRHLLCVTAFDPDIIRQAMDEAGFAPVARHWRAIYYGWQNRLRFKPARRGTQKRSWVLPLVPLYLKDRAYKVCSIFARTAPWG